METLAPSTGTPFHAPTCLPEDSPASLSASPEEDEDRKMIAGSGPSMPRPFATYDPDSQSWKTSQASLFEGWETFSGTWPSAGMMRNGRCYRRPRLDASIKGNGFSLWPTPTASDAMRLRFSLQNLCYTANKGGHTYTLNAALAVEFGRFLTPTFSEWLMGFPQNWTVPD